jgi:hypothetical protein
MYIATLSEIKAELGIADNVDDAVLLMWANGVQGRLERFLNRPLLYSAAETEIFDGGLLCLYPRLFPIVNVISLIVDAAQDWLSEDELTAANDDFRVDARAGKIWYCQGETRWPAGVQNIRVVYSGGMFTAQGGAASAWTNQGEIDLVRRAFLMQCGYEWRNRTTLGIDQLNAQGTGKKTPAALLKDVQDSLRPLMRLV